MTAATEGDLRTRLAQLDDEVLAASEAMHHAHGTDRQDEAYNRWYTAATERDDIIRQLDAMRAVTSGRGSR